MRTEFYIEEPQSEEQGETKWIVCNFILYLMAGPLSFYFNDAVSEQGIKCTDKTISYYNPYTSSNN